MAAVENPRAVRPVLTKPNVLSGRAWRDIRRARKLGADGLGGGIRLHGVEIFFSRRSATKDAASQDGQFGHQDGQQRDDSDRRQRRRECPPAGDSGSTTSARQRRQQRRLQKWQQAVRHNLQQCFRQWAEAAQERLDQQLALIRRRTFRDPKGDWYRGSELSRQQARSLLRSSIGKAAVQEQLQQQRRGWQLRSPVGEPPGEPMDDERAPKRGLRSPASRKAAAKGPSTPDRPPGGSGGGTPPSREPKRRCNLEDRLAAVDDGGAGSASHAEVQT